MRVFEAAPRRRTASAPDPEAQRSQELSAVKKNLAKDSALVTRPGQPRGGSLQRVGRAAPECRKHRPMLDGFDATGLGFGATGIVFDAVPLPINKFGPVAIKQSRWRRVRLMCFAPTGTSVQSGRTPSSTSRGVLVEWASMPNPAAHEASGASQSRLAVAQEMHVESTLM